MEKELDIKLINSFVENTKEIQLLESKINSAIVSLQKELGEKTRQNETLKTALKNAMIENGVKKFENDVISLTYVAPYEKTTLDTTKLKEEKPEIYDEYSKISQVSDSIRIKVK